MVFDKQYFTRRSIEQKHYVLADIFIDYFHDCETFFDYGCGEGFFIHAFKHSEPGIKIRGYEPNLSLLTPFGNSNGLITSSIPEGESYDLVICFDVLEHIPEPQISKVIDDLFKLTKKYLLLSVCTAEVWPYNRDNTHITFHTKSWWNELFVKKGFIPLEVPQSFIFVAQTLLYKKSEDNKK